MADTASAVAKMEKSMGHASYLIDRAILHGRSQKEITVAQKALSEARYAAERGAARDDETAVIAAEADLAAASAGLEDKPSTTPKVNLWYFTPVVAVIAMLAAAGVIARRRKRAHWAKLMADFADYETFLKEAAEKHAEVAKLKPTPVDLFSGDKDGEVFCQQWHLGLHAMKDKLHVAGVMVDDMRSLASLNDPSKRPTAAEQAMFEDDFAHAYFYQERERATLIRELQWMGRLFDIQVKLAKASKIIQAYRPIPEDLDTVLADGLTPREMNESAEQAATNIATARIGLRLHEYEDAEEDANVAAELAERLAPVCGKEPIAVTVTHAVKGAAWRAELLGECWTSACELQGKATAVMSEKGLEPDDAFDEAVEDLADIPHELAIASRQLAERQHLAANGTLALVSARLTEVRQTFDAVIDRQAS